MPISALFNDVDALAQLFARFEVRDIFPGQFNLVPSLGVAAHTGRTIVQ